MKIFGFLFLAIITVVLSGCRNLVDQKLTMADALIEAFPDSALSILKGIDGTKANDERRAHLYLLQAKAMVKAHRNIESDSLIAKAAQFYENRKDSLEVQSKLYYGMALRYQKKYEASLTPLTLAYDLAMSLNEYKYAGIAARELAYDYCMLLAVEQELYWAQKERECFMNGGYYTHADWAISDLISGLLQNGRQEEALRLIEQIDSGRPVDDPYFLNPIRYYKAAVLHGLGQPEKALETYEDLLEEDGWLTSAMWYRMALDYRRTGQKEKTTMALDSARRNAKTHLDSIWVTDLEAKMAADRGDYRTAYDLAVRFGEEIMRDGDRRIGHPASSALTDTLREKYAVEQRLHQSKRKIIWLSITVGILTFLLLTGVIWIMALRLRARKEELDAMATKADALTRDLANLTELSDRKDRKSSEAVRELLATNTRTLDRLCSIWFHQPHSQGARQAWHREFLRELESLRSEEKVKEMEVLIDRHSDDWMARFRHTFPNLTDEQYRLAMYLFLGFSYESIAILMNKTQVNTVYGAKNRLKTKLLSLATPEAQAFCRHLRL